MSINPPMLSPDVLGLCRMIDRLTVPSTDDGAVFTNLTRLHLIQQSLSKSYNYVLFGDKPLAKIYRHNHFDASHPCCLVSCHIDSVYNMYFSDSPADDSKVYEEIRGTYDNALCNAILVDLLMQGGLPPQVLVAFTGDEEFDSLGAVQTVAWLEAQNLRAGLAFICVMDLTEEAYGDYPITIENVFINEAEKLIAGFPHRIFEEAGIQLPVIEKEAPDESWDYDEYGCNCFSLCLPCRLLGDNMHEDKGVAVRVDSLFLYRWYMDALLKGWAESNVVARSL